MFLQGKTELPLVNRNIPDHVLVCKVAIQAQESVQSLKEQNVVPRKSVIFNELSVDLPPNAPALEALNVS